MTKNSDVLLTIEQLEHALDFINPDMPYEEWARVGRAIKVEFGEEAFSSFDSFSQGGSSYKASDVRDQWKSFGQSYAGGKRPGLGTIIYFAKIGGWKPTGSNLSPEEKAFREKERAESAARRAEQEAAAAVEREQLIKGSYQDFMRLPAESGATGPTLYMLSKGMADLADYVAIRYARNAGALGRWFAWSLYDDDPRVNPDAAFCGYERVFDEKNTGGKNKFISRHGKNNRGFAVLGASLNASARAFVVGGIADAYSAHVSTGETVVATVGEGNIPGIIQHLSALYPEVEFIAAPDNDKAGLRAAKKLGGFWSVPEMEGRDWSDVFLIQGAGEVKRQLLSIKGFKHNSVDQRYLNIEIHEGLNLIKSAKETGKSYSTARYFEKNPNMKVLVISYRKSLLQSLAEEFSAEYYEDLVLAGSKDNNQLLRAAQRLVITPDSLWRLHGSKWDAVFVDEAEQTIQHFMADSMGKREFNADMLRHLLLNSDIQILADADMSDLTLKFCDHLGMHHGVFHHNAYRPRVGSKMYVYESPNHLNTAYKDRLHAGDRLFYCSNSKGQVKGLAGQLEIEQKRGTFKGSFFSVSSENSNEIETAAIVKDINNRIHDWQALLTSPSWGTGISIRRDDEFDHGIAATYGRFSSQSGTSEQAHQQLARVRGITEYHVYVEPRTGESLTDSDLIRRILLEDPTAETAEYLKLGPEGELTFCSEIYEWIYCNVTAHLNLSRNDFKGRFLAQAEAEGYEIIQVTKNALAANFGKEDAEESSYRIGRFDLLTARDADLLDDAQHQAAKNGAEGFTHESVKKTDVYKDLNLASATDEQVAALQYLAKESFSDYRKAGEFDDEVPVTAPEDPREAVLAALTFREMGRREVGRIKKLAVAALPIEVARELDIRDRKFSASRAALRHTSKRRWHLLRILKAFGIDEQLNYNGTVWSGSQVSKALRTWLRRNRESLLQYSGVTITSKAFDDPLQWAHGFLERHAIKVENRGQRTIQAGKESKRENVYAVDEHHLGMIRELVMLRVAGIEQGLNAVDVRKSPAHPEPLLSINNSGQGVQQLNTPNPNVSAAFGGSEGKDLFPNFPADLGMKDLSSQLETRGQLPVETEWLNAVDMSQLQSLPAAAVAAHKARAEQQPQQAMATMLEAAERAGMSGITALEYLSDGDMADIMTGELSAERLGLIFNGFMNAEKVRA